QYINKKFYLIYKKVEKIIKYIKNLIYGEIIILIIIFICLIYNVKTKYHNIWNDIPKIDIKLNEQIKNLLYNTNILKPNINDLKILSNYSICINGLLKNSELTLLNLLNELEIL